MSGYSWQIIGLILNFIGVIFLGIGALDRSAPTWDDMEKVSVKAIWIQKLAWFGVIITALGFIIQIIGLR